MFFVILIITFLFLYPMLVVGKWEDEQLKQLFEKKNVRQRAGKNWRTKWSHREMYCV